MTTKAQNIFPEHISLKELSKIYDLKNEMQDIKEQFRFTLHDFAGQVCALFVNFYLVST